MKKKLSTVTALVGAMILADARASGAQNFDELIAAAQAERQLTVVALPRTWCNYSELIDSFTKTYGITVEELDPDAGSADALDMIRKPSVSSKAPVPDVIDVNLAAASRAKTEGLIQPYRVTTWDTIPDAAKDIEGYWYGGYYGLLSFMVNRQKLRDELPRDWPDLLRPYYAQSVSLTGDPSQFPPATHAVFAAGYSPTTEKDPAKAAAAGVEFFAEMNSRGNFLPIAGSAASLAQGTTPILIGWDYNTLGWAEDLAGNPPIDVVIPQSGLVANLFVQAIAADARHPNAAKLWMEHLYSDEGQLMWLKGHCNPVRITDLAQHNRIPADLLEPMQPIDRHERVVFPTLEQQRVYRDTIVRTWTSSMKAAAN